jgi:hypothetical protein
MLPSAGHYNRAKETEQRMPPPSFGLVKASVTLTTAASPAAVWSAFEEAPRWPEVLADLLEARIAPDGKLAPGAVIRSKARPNTRAVDMRYDVIEAVPAQSLILASHWKGLRGRTRYLFEPIGDGTRITVASEMATENLIGRLVMAFWRAQYATQLVASLQTRTQALLNLAERM